MDIIFKGLNNTGDFIIDKNYTVASKFRDLYRIVDEYGDDYLYSINEKDWFLLNLNDLEIEEENFNSLDFNLYDDNDTNLMVIKEYFEHILGYKEVGPLSSLKDIAVSLSNFSFLMKESFVLNYQTKIEYSNYVIPKGTKVVDVVVISEGTSIKVVRNLVNKYRLQNGGKTSVKDWKKMRGTAIAINGENKLVVEIHWYQCKNIGKVDFKIKRVLMDLR